MTAWVHLGNTAQVPRLEAAVKFLGKTALATASLILLGACSGAPVATTTNVTTTAVQTPSSAMSPLDAARDNATNAYRQMWSDFAAAGTTSDWQSPRLGQHATGIALNKLSQSLYGDNYRGLITKGQPVLRPSVTALEPAGDPTKIVITDCGDSTNWLKYRKDNGVLADDKPGGRHLISSTVEKQADGSWKVSDYGVHDVGSC
ncbi:hypothetical protein [Lentzea sp. HUAS12]|uniref:hypothetical protein n=1 Tax=Lentzea sp. HUAS12 TaxID=2951806 RepID=UPI00209F8F00|nr:hypothetical protein [Lentzea sp. HUAS12]USX56437.1 hypothetical protein ND450_20745 [Lentzea sp. HUAS12]